MFDLIVDIGSSLGKLEIFLYLSNKTMNMAIVYIEIISEKKY